MRLASLMNVESGPRFAKVLSIIQVVRYSTFHTYLFGKLVIYANSKWFIANMMAYIQFKVHHFLSGVQIPLEYRTI